MSSEYSHRDFTGRTLIEADDLGGQEIVGSCFSQEIPDTVIFPKGMKGVVFKNCNLDNVVIPDGNKFIDCSTIRFEVQNDLNDWEIDRNDIPVCVLDYLYFYKNDLPHPDPASIPDEPVEERIDYREAQ